ncbi:MAG: nicotinate-nucleotide diphosphorylase (carboxylating), partial [Planctomycetota bacterium]
MPSLHDFITPDDLRRLIDTARREDLGPAGLDATSSLFIEADRRCTARIVARRGGVVSGLALLPEIITAYDETVRLDARAVDG